jgi:uncharacterized membrane protein
MLVYGIVGIGVVGLLVGIFLDQHLAGTVIYLVAAWGGGGIAILAPRLSNQTLQDERDYELHNQASGLTMKVMMVIGLSTVPAIYVLDAGGIMDIGGQLGGAILLGSALFIVYGACFGYVKRRSTR